MPTVRDAATKLSIPGPKVITLIKTGVIDAEKISNRWAINQASLDAYANSLVAPQIEDANVPIIPQLENINIPFVQPFENVNDINARQNQRRLPDAHNGIISTIANNPFAVSELLDFGPKEFWDQHAKNLLDTLPMVIEKHTRIPQSLNSSTMPLAAPHVTDYSDKRLLLQPTLEYAIPKQTEKRGKIKPAVVTKKFKIRVCGKIRKVWFDWILLSNEVYNYSIDFLIQKRIENPFYKPEKLTLSDIIIKHFTPKITAACAPAEVSKYAVFDAVAAFNMGLDLQKRSLDNYSLSIAIRSRGIKNGFICKQNTKRALQNKYNFDAKFASDFEKMQMKLHNFPKTLPKVYCRLIYKTRLDKWYLDVPTEICKETTIREQIVAIDPGIRTFLTCYSSSGVFNIGADVESEIKSLYNAIDSINEKISASNNKRKKQSLTRALCRVTKKIQNKIDNLHWHAIKLLSRFNTVILPKFGVTRMSKNLANKTNRNMYALSHFEFRVRLAQKTSQYGNKIIICNEAYTSKTCGGCGALNEKLNGAKHFACNSCKFEMGRDLNGARNIMARVLSFGDALL